MKTSLNIPFCNLLFIALAGGLSSFVLEAQTTNTSSISPELAAELQAIEQQPTLPASNLPDGGHAGTFYSAQHPNWPPFPEDSFGVPVWNLGDNHYLLEDFGINYANTAATTTAAKAMVASTGATLVGNSFSPDFSTQNGPYLTINQTGTNGIFQLTIWNNQSPANYELWWTPVLANPDYPWTMIAVGNGTQTNFTVNMTYPTAFYSAVWDTNSIPLWEAADPNNPSAGILSVFIDSPANGAVLQ